MGCCASILKGNVDKRRKSLLSETDIKYAASNIVVRDARTRRAKQSLTENLVLEVFDRELNDFYETTAGEMLGNFLFEAISSYYPCFD